MNRTEVRTRTEFVGVLRHYLHRKDLTERSACMGGLKVFDALVREQRRKSSLRVDHAMMLRLCKEHYEYFAWARIHRLLPRFEAQEVTFETQLERVGFFDGNFEGARFQECILNGSSWRGAALDRATFQRAEMDSVRIFSSSAEQANFTDAKLTRSVFGGVRARTALFIRANLAAAMLSHLDLSIASFRDADLRGARFFSCRLEDADFTGARRRRNDPAIDGWKVVRGRMKRL